METLTKTKTGRRIAWLNAHAGEINSIISNNPISTHGPRGGTNTARIPGWSSGGWGWWAEALRQSSINCPVGNYWSGSAPMPSTSIHGMVADYIKANAPKELM